MRLSELFAFFTGACRCRSRRKGSALRCDPLYNPVQFCHHVLAFPTGDPFYSRQCHSLPHRNPHRVIYR